jgi:protein SCO1/2
MSQSTIRCALLAAALLAPSACKKVPPEHGMIITSPLPAAPLAIPDSRGRLFDLAAQKGKPVLLYFGYTHCPDVCPQTLADFARARRLAGGAAAGVPFVFVTVDPDRDTPAVAESYARQFDSTFVGLAPSKSQLDTIKAVWGFAVERDSMPGMKADEYGVTHPAGVFFIDRDGKVEFIFAPGTKPQDIATDLRRLL